ncbi:MAG: RNA polymerase-binding protein DksA [Pseudomonadota bacterium]
MDKTKLKFFKELLNKRMQDLANEAKDTVVEMTDDDDTFPDPNDRATLESDRNFVLRIRDRERKLKSKVERALERLENGTFGICEECGDDISEGRLKARPVTTLCIKCKEEQEKQEKSRQTK